MDDRRKIGAGLTAFGVLFFLLGILFFFDKALLSMGNLLFVSGLTLTLGPKATFKFFFGRRNFKGSGAFLGGLLLVLMGWVILGMIVQGYGFFLLFANFLPSVLVYLRHIPVLGALLNAPGVRSVIKRFDAVRLPV
mmetsp:Transcript_20486/g.66529  ORF Transcript_20486/g.66529 Transcript_20486/m.66529 type:complete len:136 (+) Transcript_20486:89-496(+)